MCVNYMYFAGALLLVPLVTGELCTSQICEYSFTLHWKQTMTYYGPRSYPVVLNGTDLVAVSNSFLDSPFLNPINATGIVNVGDVIPPENVITADGLVRDVIVVNGMFPGPTIEVMQGTQIVVHVTNSLVTEAVTLHWHGMYVTNTPFMDGAHHITQCGINAGQTFTYRIKADPPGTHWYHSHVGIQALDGGYGMIVVHEQAPTTPSHSVFVSDWFKEGTSTFTHINPYMATPGTGGDLFNGAFDKDFSPDDCDLASVHFNSALINGRGRTSGYDGFEPYPLEVFEVTAMSIYRFRVVCSAAEFAFEMSIDEHNMTVVAMDGHEIQPIVTDSIIIGRGETLDFELTADQGASIYWFRATTLRLGTGRGPQPDGIIQEVRAVLSYDAALTGDPTSTQKVCTQVDKCLVFACPWEAYVDTMNKTCIGIESAVAAGYNKEYGLDTPDDEVLEVFMNYAFNGASSINARQFSHSKVPILGMSSDEIPNQCDDAVCDENGCVCFHVLDIPLGTTVQMVFTNLNPNFAWFTHHGIHTHGYSFAILKMGYALLDNATGYHIDHNQDVACNNFMCSSPTWSGPSPNMNMQNPPVRDTLTVPARGYAVVRFIADNPGYWLFHCHQVTHHIEGMAMVVNVGPGQHPPLPPDFRQCNDYEFSEEQYENYQNNLYPSDTDATLSSGELAGIIIGSVAGGILLGVAIMLIANWISAKNKVSADVSDESNAGAELTSHGSL